MKGNNLNTQSKVDSNDCKTNTGSTSTRDKRNSHGRRNNKSRRSSDKSKPNKESTITITKDDINDSSYYYAENGEVLKNELTNYSMTGVLGVNTKVGYYNDPDNNTQKNIQYGVPSLMRIDINPALETDIAASRRGGVNNAGIYKAANKIYYLLTANNAKTSNYLPHDIIMLIVALAQVLAFISYIRRIFGFAFKYNVRNRDLPEKLISGSRVDYDDFRRNMANYRIRFNSIINSLNKIPIPSNIAYIAKWSVMFDNLYKDEFDNPLTQMYFLHPHSFWKFNEIKSEAGSGFDTVGNGTETMSVKLDKLEEMINAILQSQTFTYIFPDILRMNEKSGWPLYTVPVCLEGYDTPELFSEEFNMWVENAEIVGTPIEAQEGRSTPSNDVLTNASNLGINYNPLFSRNATEMEGFLNFKKPNPDVEMKIAATRLKRVNLWWIGEQQTNRTNIACGDSYVVGLCIYGTSPIDNSRGWNIYIDNNGMSAGSLNRTAVYFYSALTQFNYAPKIIIVDPQDSDRLCACVIGTLDYYSEVSSNTLELMWDTEWIGLLEAR